MYRMTPVRLVEPCRLERTSRLGPRTQRKGSRQQGSSQKGSSQQ